MDDNIYTQKFNPLVHQANDVGDPLRKEDGSLKLKTNWKTVAEDRQGRHYNPHIHGENPKLDEFGYLRVRPREAQPGPSGINRSKAFIAKYQEKGYAYYLANDDGGRLEQFVQNDWEPVLDEKGVVAQMPVGQARSPGTTARLFRKPVEWYEADQNAKVARNKARAAASQSPKEEEGQYQAAESSPLR